MIPISVSFAEVRYGRPWTGEASLEDGEESTRKDWLRGEGTLSQSCKKSYG